MPRGGRRPGAGRKKKFRTEVLEALGADEIVRPWLPDLLRNLKQLADGVVVAGVVCDEDENPVMDEEGRPLVKDVRTTAPDRQANEYLIDRVCGKPASSVDVTSGGQQILLIPDL